MAKLSRVTKIQRTKPRNLAVEAQTKAVFSRRRRGHQRVESGLRQALAGLEVLRSSYMSAPRSLPNNRWARARHDMLAIYLKESRNRKDS